MTDNEIIKALELCATLDSRNCKKCPCREICKENDGTLTKLILDLINRQNVEIERLKKEVEDKEMDERNKIGVMYEELLKEKAELEKRIEFHLGKIEAYEYCIDSIRG